MNIKFGVFRHHSTHFRPRAAFTLIELLMVIAIIGILASLIIVSLRGAGTKARDTKVKSNAANVDKALGQYEIDNGQLFPLAVTQTTVLLGLASLVPNYLKTNAALTPATGQDTGYISNYSRTSYAQAWELENTTEATITTGNGVYASNSANAGGVVATPAKGSAINFNGTTVTIPNNLAFQTNAFSISLWVKPNVATSGSYVLVHKWSLGGWRIYLVCNGTTCAPTADYPATAGTATGAVISPGIWSHIVVTYSSGSVIVYVNGVGGIVGSITYGTANSTNANSILMGTGASLSNLNGIIDGLRLYNRVLTSGEVGTGSTSLYNSGNGSYGSLNEVATGILVGGWRFDEGTGGNGTLLANYNTANPNGTLTTIGSGTWTAGNAPLGLTVIGSLLTGKAFVTYR
ncbi:MAG: LamG-like jellyroll fold domain-containing protein [Patescibacteria group bacterium]